MSRSIHDTWGVLRRVRREDYADPEEKREHLRALRGNIRLQRALREQARHQRRRRGLSLPSADPEAIPIVVSDEGPFVHHAASAEDVREVLRRLPPGMLDGLCAVHLCLCQRPASGDEDAVDPYLRRPADELLPSVYQHAVRGEAARGGGEVRVFAYIHAVGAAGLHAVHLRMRSLATLVHECSHHFDSTFRGERERWHKRDEARNETYVRARALEIVEACVVPLLEERYPQECRALSAWMEHHAGVALPLAILADDRDSICAIADWAYCTFVRALAAGEDIQVARKELALGLLTADHPSLAAIILERVLAERPDDPDTVLKLADAHRLAGHVAHAERLSARLAELAPEDARTWALAIRLHRQSARLEEQARCAERLLAIGEAEGRERAMALFYRAEAWLGLGRADALAADVAALAALGSPAARARARVLSLRSQCQAGRWEEALAATTRALRDDKVSFLDLPFVKAVRFECAARLGRRRLAGKLNERDLEMLRGFGQGAWVDRLVADLGLRPEKKLRYSG